MDILAARKKAAEGARTKKKAGAERAPAVPIAAVEAPAPEEQQPREHAPIVDAAAKQDAAVAPASEPDEALSSQVIEMLSFRLGGEEYIVKVEQVKEVLKLMELTPVPHTPEYIPGVISLRGSVLPVFDLCKRLGLADGIRDEKSRIVVVSLDEEDVGLLVDRVTGVVRIPPDAVRPAPESIEQGAEFLRGIARKDEKLYILLDLEKAAGV